MEYDGQIKIINGANAKHGYGRLTFPDGAYYEGYWLEDKACGRGIFRTKEGHVVMGNWSDDQLTGLSKFENISNDPVYEGGMKADK